MDGRVVGMTCHAHASYGVLKRLGRFLVEPGRCLECMHILLLVEGYRGRHKDIMMIYASHFELTKECEFVSRMRAI